MMKNASKRIIALVLTLCMTLSVLPPMVFAVEGEQNPGQTGANQIIYDFDLRSREYSYENGTAVLANQNISTTTAAVSVAGKQHVDSLYQAGTSNWKYHSVGNTSAGSATQYGFCFGAASALFALNLRAGASSAQVPGGFFAMTVKTPGTGSYQLTLDYLPINPVRPRAVCICYLEILRISQAI